MRILVANVNTTETMTDGIAEAARAVASAGTEIIPITPDFGAESCEGNFELSRRDRRHGRRRPL
jgi:allantoin racemase